MKKHFLFIITLLFVFKAGQGQTNMYHPFPDSNVVWSNSQINYFCAEGNCCTGMFPVPPVASAQTARRPGSSDWD